MPDDTPPRRERRSARFAVRTPSSGQLVFAITDSASHHRWDAPPNTRLPFRSIGAVERAGAEGQRRPALQACGERFVPSKLPLENGLERSPGDVAVESDATGALRATSFVFRRNRPRKADELGRSEGQSACGLRVARHARGVLPASAWAGEIGGRLRPRPSRWVHVGLAPQRTFRRRREPTGLGPGPTPDTCAQMYA